MLTPQALRDYFTGLFTSCEHLRSACKRKTVVAHAVEIKDGVLTVRENALNIPVGECSGEQGNCGCLHAEVRLILLLLKYTSDNQSRFILACPYSPCTQCANAILASGLFRGVVYQQETLHDLRGLERLRENLPTAKVTGEEFDAHAATWISSAREAR